MNIKDIRLFLGEDFNYQKKFEEFKIKANNSYFTENEGGLDFVGGAWLYSILQKIKPKRFIECGVWRGFSSWVFNEINNYNAMHILFDPGFAEKGFNNLLKFRVEKGTYLYQDFGSTQFSGIAKDATIFFDDHQDYLERLFLSYSRGAKYVIFDDNYFFGGGGHHSLMDHFRNDLNCELFKIVVKAIYVVPPLLLSNRGIQPFYLNNYSDGKFFIDSNNVNEDKNYNWMTLVELNLCPTSPKSQGQVCLV